MFYRMYLSSVCHRRQWPDPQYEPYRTRNGHLCKVRVNNREYGTDVPYESEELARDAAAMKAFMICRNFSYNDGMYPGQRPGQAAAGGASVQGLPVAIGTGRRSLVSASNRSSASSTSSYDRSAASSALSETETLSSSAYSSADGLSSGENSPKSLASGFEQQMRAVTQQMPRALPRPRGPSSTAPRHHHRHHHHPSKHHAAAPTASSIVVNDEYMCLCRRGAVRAYGRCGWCLRESGWA